MNGLLNLKPYIGSEKTLVIACSEFGIEEYEESHSKMYIHLAPESSLLRYDPNQREIIQHYIERKSCSQVILVGANDPKLIERIESDDSFHSIGSGLKFNLKALLLHKHNAIINPAVRTQMLMEIHIIRQCKLLFDYYFVKEKVETESLQVKGIVTLMKSDTLKSIFHNGIIYNDLLTLN